MSSDPQTPNRTTKRKEPPSIIEERQAKKMYHMNELIKKIPNLNRIDRIVFPPIAINVKLEKFF